MKPHSCGWCACWLELKAVHDEGRQLEAKMEAKRLMRNGFAMLCLLATRTLAHMFPEAFAGLDPLEKKLLQLKGAKIS